MTDFTDLLADFESEKQLICHLQPYDPDGAAVVDLYYSTHGFTSEPGDTPANTHYAARLKKAYQFQRSLFEVGKLSGRSIPGVGSIVLLNRDGGLDALADYGWGGRRVRVWLGGTDFDLDDFGLIFDGTAEGIELGDGEIKIVLRDLKYRFDREIQSERFAGTGAEEGNSDVAGRRKPLTLGICRNVPILYIGTNGSPAKHIFSAGEGPIIGVLRVLDQGVELTYTSGTPSSGEWTVDVATGVVTLGGSYVGPVTADIIGHRYVSTTSTTSWAMATGSKQFAAPFGVVLHIGSKVRVGRTSALGTTWGDGVVTAIDFDDVGFYFTIDITSLSTTTGTFSDWTLSPWGTVAGFVKEIGTRMGVTSFDLAIFGNLESAQPATCGYYIPEGGNALQHLDAICNGASCHYGFTRDGEFSIGRLEAPGSPADSMYDTSDLLDDTLIRHTTEEPNYEVVVRYKKNWAGAFSSNQMAGAVTDTDRAFLTQEWRQEVDTDSAVQTAFPLSRPIELESIFDESTAAAAEATRLLTMFGVVRGYYTGRFKVKPLTLDIGGISKLTHNRYGLSGGENFRRVDVGDDLDLYEVELGLWG
jgi:hypothetical protein